MRRSFRVVSLLVCFLNLANGQGHDFLASSITDTVRTGATIFSRFLNPGTVFHKITEEIQQAGRRGNKDGGESVWLLLRLMGVDSGKITDFAFDGVVSIVLLMNKILLMDGEKKRKERKTSKDFSLFNFILNQPQVVDLLTPMRDPNLVDLILKESTEKLKNQPKENVECIKLLICKTKPFVRGMQRSLEFFMNRENIKISGFTGERTCQEEKPDEETCHKEEKEEEEAWEKESLADRMYFFMPSLREAVQVGDECERAYPSCLY